MHTDSVDETSNGSRGIINNQNTHKITQSTKTHKTDCNTNKLTLTYTKLLANTSTFQEVHATDRIAFI